MAHAKRLLIVERDPAMRSSLAEQVGLLEGFAVSEAEDGAAALARLAERAASLVLLDTALPDMDGRDLCRLIRRRGIKVPVIVLSGEDSEADAILAFDSGANDYVGKPFRLGVLLARIRAHLRHFELSDDATFTVGPYEFRPSTKMLIPPGNGRKLHLTEKETAILKFLYRVGDRPVARDVLLNEVWGYAKDVNTHTLESHIYRLRQKIEPDPRESRLLLTEAGGYRLAR